MRRGLYLAGAALFLSRLFARRRRALATFDGCVAVVTGGSRGLGLRIAERLAQRGCALAICARTSDELHAAGLSLARHGRGVLTEVCDVADARAVAAFIRRVEERFGHIDILVNNAGIIQAGPLEDMTLDDFRHIVDIDFFGVVNATQAVLPEMRRRRAGRIVTIASIGGEVIVPHLVPYGCAKAAALAFSEGLEVELAGSGVSVTTVIPWLMRTGSIPYVFFKGDQDREHRLFSLGQRRYVSVDGERAAERIVRGIASGERRVRVGVIALAAEKVHALVPSLFTFAFGAVNVLLPRGKGAALPAVRGKTLDAARPRR